MKMNIAQKAIYYAMAKATDAKHRMSLMSAFIAENVEISLVESEVSYETHSGEVEIVPLYK